MIKLLLLLFILMFGWSTGVLFSVANHLMKRFGGDPPAGFTSE